jgi:hypothetical protein
MKTTFLSRIAITLGLALAVGAPLSVRADGTQKPSSNSTDTTARRERIHKWILKKFDTNHNGKLDPDEREALKKWLKEHRGQSGGLRHAKPDSSNSPTT